jgi:hypothetical protein
MKELILHLKSLFQKLMNKRDDDWNNPYIVL